ILLFFSIAPPPTTIYTLSLHDALPICLFNETKEALEQQTATADVLKTISRSAFDLQAVFDVVVENATKLCRGDWGYLFRKEGDRSEEHTSELQSRFDLVCRLLLEKKKK